MKILYFSRKDKYRFLPPLGGWEGGGYHYHKEITPSKACFLCDSFLRSENGSFLWLSACTLYKHCFFFCLNSSSCHFAEWLMCMYRHCGIDLTEQWVVLHVCVNTDRNKLCFSGKCSLYKSNRSSLSAPFTIYLWQT